MANDLSRKPWSLDTAAVITTDRIRIRSLHWVAGANGDTSTAGDNCQVEDSGGERIWEVTATGANFDKESYFGDKGRNFQGFELAAIDNGVLYVDLA